MNRSSKRLVFFDLETGGLSPKRHPIIQLAAMAVDDTLKPLETFEAKVAFDERTAKSDSLRKNHYSRGRWAKEAREPEEVAADFADFLRRHATSPMLAADGRAYQVAQLAAHNAAFDGEFLRVWYERLSMYLPARYQVLCTLQRALWLFSEQKGLPPPANFKLATLCQYFEVPFHAASAHEALGDVSATVRLYEALLRTGQRNDADLTREGTEAAGPSNGPGSRSSHLLAEPSCLPVQADE